MESESISGGILVLLLILFLAIIGSNLLRQKNFEYIQDTGLSALLGALFGLVLELLGETPQIKSITSLNSEFVLYVLLPPIIFKSGYNIDKYHFFGNFGEITLFSFLGSLISTFIIAWGCFLLNYFNLVTLHFTLSEAFTFGVIISSTDPTSVIQIMEKVSINSDLYSIIIGEGLLNGAISISLFRIIKDNNQSGSFELGVAETIFRFFYTFFGSFFIGGLIALIISFVLKRFAKVDNHMNVGVTAVIFGPWISFLISEGFMMNGPVSILFCGIFMARYTTPNLLPATQTMINRGYSVITYSAEILVYIFLGMGLFSFNLPYYKLSLTSIILIFLIILTARASSIICCSWILSFTKTEIQSSFQIVMWLTSLKGVIAFALATRALAEFKQGDLMILFTILYSITGVIVKQTLFVGATLKSLIEKLNVIGSQASKVQQWCGWREYIESLEKRTIYPCLVNEEQQTNILGEAQK